MKGKLTFQVGKVGRLGWLKTDKGDAWTGRMPDLLLSLVKSEGTSKGW